jgi:hypothetical protein
MPNNYAVTDVPIKLGSVEYDNNLSTDLKIDRNDLDSEFANQARLYAYYGTMAALAESRRQHLKNELELLYAHLDAEKRNQARVEAESMKIKFTETMFENMVKSDPRYQTKMKEYLNTQELANILDVGKKAFEHRKDMLVSLGANHRQSTTMDKRVMTDYAKGQ